MRKINFEEPSNGASIVVLAGSRAFPSLTSALSSPSLACHLLTCRAWCESILKQICAAPAENIKHFQKRHSGSYIVDWIDQNAKNNALAPAARQFLLRQLPLLSSSFLWPSGHRPAEWGQSFYERSLGNFSSEGCWRVHEKY